MKNLSARTLSAIAAAAVVLAVPALSSALPVADYTAPAARDTEPVVLTGKDFPDWGTRSNVTAKAPLTDLPDSGPCAANDDACQTHNNYADPELDTQGETPASPTPVDRLLGYKWDGTRFVQIPFQVDEMFTRYLDNSASGFAFYSGEDQHTTYAFDREGFRFTESDPNNPCLAKPADGQGTTPDPVAGLDDNDEMVFMASDAATPAPADAPRPAGIQDMREVQITDPTDTDTKRSVYVAKAGADGPAPKYNADNGYVHYQRDANADYFERSQSSYSGYGNAARGVVCDAQGNVVATDERRRPRDYATVTTDRYKFRYDGRWLMTDLRISPDGGDTFGPDLVDRWKARAFQQDPSSETPCCGYEEEDTNWGGSSTLLGERWGPVRAIRETWGADSGTNVIRRETFYRDEVRQKSYLRVHVIPPLDGIYAQWDYNAGRMTRFYNSAMATPAEPNPPGVAIDGINDEVFGNLDDPCNGNYDQNTTSDLDQQYRALYSSLPGLCTPVVPMEQCAVSPVVDGANGFIDRDPTGQVPRVPSPCGQFPYHQSVDFSDPTMSEPNSGLQWNVTAGPDGSIVDRYQIDKVTDESPGGAAQSVFAVPYYRDDSCFDDGTGSDPGPKLHLRSSDEPRTYTAPDGSTKPRECWTPDSGTEDLGTNRFYQGSIGTHGLHILMLAESDNARQTVPVTELVAEQRMVMLPGQRDASVGEQYGRGFDKALVATVVPDSHPANVPPEASFDYTPDAPQTGREVSFQSTSTDQDGGIESEEWDLDGDGQFDDAEGQTATHTFASTGDHTVALRVTDTSGAVDTAEATITVTNPPPTATFSYTPAQPVVRDTVTFTASATDENGSVASYAWDLDADGAFDDGSTAVVKRVFGTPGAYQVALRVTDNEGAATEVARTVDVKKRGGRKR